MAENAYYFSTIKYNISPLMLKHSWGYFVTFDAQDHPMNENEIKRYFKIIDYGIKVFNADKGFKVDNKPYSDWLVFEQRTMKRNKNDLNYVIQIYPNFDEREEITAWTLYGSVWYDTDKNRYLADFSPASKVQLKQIALNIAKLLKETYNVISTIAKNDIPFATELS